MSMLAMSLPSNQRLNGPFAEWAKRIAAGRSLRELSRTSGISHTRISDMQFGVVPTYRLMERFCEALNLSDEDRAEGFRLAGYTPTATGQHPSQTVPYDRFREVLEQRNEARAHAASPREYYLARYGALVELCLSIGIDPPAPLHGGGSGSIDSYERADRIIEQLVAHLQADYPERAASLSPLLSSDSAES